MKQQLQAFMKQTIMCQTLVMEQPKKYELLSPFLVMNNLSLRHIDKYS